jgi:DNA-binding NarL/FixJ family response regulator
VKRVLIADDHEVVRNGLVQALGRTPALEVVGEAATGEQTLEMVRTLRPDLVLLDLSMPGRSGLDLVAQICDEFPDTRVLVLSMHPEDQYAERVMRCGAMGFVSKGSAVDELMEAVCRALEGRPYVSAALAERLALRLGTQNPGLPHDRLSDREYLVMHRLANGQTVSEIAGDLGLSAKTVSTYRGRILEKLELRNNVELTHYAVRNGLIDL